VREKKRRNLILSSPTDSLCTKFLIFQASQSEMWEIGNTYWFLGFLRSNTRVKLRKIVLMQFKCNANATPLTTTHFRLLLLFLQFRFLFSSFFHFKSHRGRMKIQIITFVRLLIYLIAIRPTKWWILPVTIFAGKNCKLFTLFALQQFLIRRGRLLKIKSVHFDISSLSLFQRLLPICPFVLFANEKVAWDKIFMEFAISI
jgi:hypothetical protein